MGADLTPYVPRLVLTWDESHAGTRHARIEGTLVFADVSGFTRLSERLAQAGGRLGAEQMAEVVDGLFDQLLAVAVERGGEMLKYGGDAVLLFFRGERHPARAVAGAVEMQRRLRDIGRVETGAGAVRMRMSVGMHTGEFDMFLVGRSHRELVVAGPATNTTIEMEAAAEATEVLVSTATAAAVDGAVLGPERSGGRLVRRPPPAPMVPPEVVEDEAGAARFLPAALREHLEAGAVHAEHRLVTQAFVHITGLDAMLERDGADAAAEALDRTVTVIQDACVRYGVTFLASDIAPDGTKVILVAGAPHAVEEPEARLAAATVAVRDSGCPLPVRVGINCGHVFTGDVGPHFRRTYTTIGDVTNTAARVMARAAPGEVLVLGRVAETLRGLYRFEQLEPFVAKGKAEPVVAHRLGTPRADGEATDGDGSPTTMPFVGRDDETRALLAALGAGPGTVVEVVGDAGVGKSRLVEEVLASVGTRVERVVCEPYESATPYGVIRHLIRHALALRADASATDLRRIVVELAPQTEPWTPLLAGVLDIEADDTPETAALEPRFVRRRTAAVIDEILAAALGGPTVLLVEDAHWADEPSAEVLAHLEDVAPDRSWSVVLTRRPSSTGHAAAHPTLAMSLDPLADHEATRLVAATCADEPLPPHRVRQIVDRSAGNPLFIGGLIRLGDLDDEEELPDSVEAIVAADIDRLPSTGRRLMRLASVHGNSFPRAQLVATARQDGVDVPLGTPAEVTRLVGGLLVAEPGDRLRFRHAVLREVAYIGLPYRQRRILHGHAADVLAAEMGEAVDDRIGVLALHEWHAGRYARCWEHSLVAGARAADKHAHAEATVVLRRALQAAGQLGAQAVDPELVAAVWEQLGDSAVMTGDAARASAHYKEARRRTSSSARLARLCGKEARLAEQAGGRSRARRWLRRGLQALDGVTDEGASTVRASLLARSAWTAGEEGRAAAAAELAAEAYELGMAVGNLEAAAHALIVLDGVGPELGRPPTDRSAEALELFDRAGAIGAKAGPLNNLGARAYYAGDWVRARALYDQARAANIAAGNIVDAGYQLYNSAEILIDQGHFDDAVPVLDELDQLWRSVRFEIGLVFAKGLRGILELRRRSLAEAHRLLGESLVRLHEGDLRVHAAPFDLAGVETALLGGSVTEAADRLEAAVAGHALATVPGADAHVLRLRAALDVRKDQVDLARRRLQDSVASARAAGSLFNVVLGLSELLALSGERGDGEVEAICTQLGIVQLPSPCCVPT